MDVEYGVKVTNKFAIIDDAMDPSEILSQLEKAAEQKAKEDKTKKKQQTKKPPASESTKKLPASTPTSDKQKTATPTVASNLKKIAETKKDEALNKENKPVSDTSGRGRGGVGPKRTPRGGGGMQGQGNEGGERRQHYENRPPRQQQERTNLPPRFGGTGGNYQNRDSNENNDQFNQGEDRFERGRGRGGRGRGGRGFGRGGPQMGGGQGFNSGGQPQDNQTGDDKRAGSGFGGFGSGAPPTENDHQAPIDDGTMAKNDGFGGFPSEESDENGRNLGSFRGRTFGRGAYRGGGFGGGGYRGSRGGFQRDGRGRQYERQSGSDRTGVKSVDKREGGGAYNWGTPQDELVGESETGNVNPADETGAENEEKGGVGENYGAPEEAQEPETKEFTLDEWKAMQGPRAKPAFNVRRAGEGEADEIKKKALVPTQKVEVKNKKQKKNKGEPQEDEPKVEEHKDEEDDDRHRKVQNAVDIVIKFADEPSRGGRGGRGTGGRGGRGGFRAAEDGAGRGRSGGFSGGFGRGNGERRGGFQNTGERGVGRREVPFKLDEETFPTLS